MPCTSKTRVGGSARPLKTEVKTYRPRGYFRYQIGNCKGPHMTGWGKGKAGMKEFAATHSRYAQHAKKKIRREGSPRVRGGKRGKALGKKKEFMRWGGFEERVSGTGGGLCTKRRKGSKTRGMRRVF